MPSAHGARPGDVDRVLLARVVIRPTRGPRRSISAFVPTVVEYLTYVAPGDRLLAR